MIVKEILAEMLDLTHDLSSLMTEADEFEIVSRLQKDIEKAEEVFLRTKNINEEPPTLQKI